MAFGFFDPQKGQSATGIAQSRAMAAALLRSGAAPRNVGEGLNAIGDAIFYRSLIGNADASEKAGTDAFNSQFNSLIAPYTGGGAAPASGSVAAAIAPTSTNWDPNNLDPSIKTGIADTASALGVSPIDLATAISYETGGTFDPTKGGPTTQWGRHRGLIQFGEPQAQKYGVDWNNPIGSQLGANGAVANYLRDTGVKPGAGLLDIYSAINAGGVGRYNASDANNGGAPGTVRDKVEQQMSGHRAKANAMFADYNPNAAMDAINTAAPQAGYRDPMVTTAYANPAPETATVAAPPLPAPTTVAAAPAVAEVAPVTAPQQVAQNFQPQQIDPRLIEAANSPFATPGQKAILGGIIQQQQARNELILKQQIEQADPAKQVDLQLKQMQLQNLKNKTSEDTFTNVGDGYLFNNRTKQFIRAPQNTDVGGTLFQGNALDAQALNKLVADGSITREQALNIAAGKVAPDPTTGALTFFPASALVGGGAQQSQEQPYIDLFGNGGNAPQQQPQQNGNGSVTLTGNRAPTEGQANAAGFSDRMINANNTLSRLESVGTDKEQSVRNSIPLIGNYLTSEDFQSYDRAKRDFINAQLRRESGAVIGESEFANAEKQYFPQPGDKPQALKDKAEARRIAIEAMGRSAGPSYSAPKQEVVSDDIRAAREAIKAGAPRDKVIERLQAAGIDTTGL